MRLDEVKLLESITFAASDVEEHPEYGQVHGQVGRHEEIDCRWCNASGVEWYVRPSDGYYYSADEYEELSDDEKEGLKQVKCDVCQGSGKSKEFISDGPELNVANRNAFVLLQLLGEEEDYAGTIWNKELPDLRRRIVRLMNSDDVAKAAIEPSEKGGELKRRVKTTGDDGVTRIEPVRTAKMMDLGLSDTQIKRYLKELLEIIEYAQKNNYNIGWS